MINTTNEVNYAVKKEQKQRIIFKSIQKNFEQVRHGAMHAGARSLLHHDTVIRNQLRKLQTLSPQISPDWKSLFDSYVSLLDEISLRILERYNQKHRTDYSFALVIDGRRESYLKSGIVSVLLTIHIPQMVSAEFARLLPDDPCREFPKARRMHRQFFLHLGDTNTGKTYQALQRLKTSGNGIYLAPLRILALENYERLNREGVPCDLLTGEEDIQIPGAQHLCCTVEKADLRAHYDVAVIDEAQLVADSQRGDAWTRAILGLCCPEIHLCGAALVKDQLSAMIDSCGDSFILNEYCRLVPLRMLSAPVRLSAPEAGDAFVAFSKRRVIALARDFRQRGVSASVIYGDLPPEVRRVQYDKFISGENPVLVATDAIGMGVNLPIRRIIFTAVEKFDGETLRTLTTQEVKQIAGRAGRIGIFDVGYVGALDRDALELIEDRLHDEDPPVQQAVVGPSEAILQIDLLPLQQKVALWSTQPEVMDRYRKKDMRNQLIILDLLKSYHLGESVEWKLMLLPFDVENEILLAQFESYVNEYFVAHQPELSRPLPPGPSRGDYEIYYQQISLYYSFSKNFDTPMDEQWVAQTRAQVSKRIQMLMERD
ncbi:DEAD/DEAH box helicase [Oscillibacter valericigenes]|nr:DEAD/DEAH box helicase [Oscillibacter valericigenes]